jgi:hypothetical protein
LRSALLSYAIDLPFSLDKMLNTHANLAALIVVGKDVEADDLGANEAAQTKIRGGKRSAPCVP